MIPVYNPISILKIALLSLLGGLGVAVTGVVSRALCLQVQLGHLEVYL